MAQVARHTQSLWTVSAPLRMLWGAIEFPGRMTMVKLDKSNVVGALSGDRDNGRESWLVHSPLKPSTLPDEVKATLLSSNVCIFAPNNMHHLHAKSLLNFLSENGSGEDRIDVCVGAPGLKEKRKDTPWNGFLDEPQVRSLLEPDLQAVLVKGIPALDETALFHPSSRTLIVTDLAFNLRKELVPNKFLSLYLGLMGGYRRCCVTKPFKFMAKDKQAIRAALDQIVEWDFDRVIMSHGAVIEEGGKEAFRDGSYAFFNE